MSDNVKLPSHSKHDFGYEFDPGVAPDVEAYAEAYAREAVRLNAAPVADGFTAENGDTLWLWKNGDHFLAFKHLYPCFSPGGDPMTLGEPFSRAEFRASHDLAAPEPQGVPEPAVHSNGMEPVDVLRSVWNAMQNSADGDDLLSKLDHMRGSIERAVDGAAHPQQPGAAQPKQERKPLSEREIELIDGMIEVQLHHAEACDRIANRVMAEKQKGWDMERVELLRKLKASHGITRKESP